MKPVRYRPFYFELLADDLARGAEFCRTAFGWRVEAGVVPGYMRISTAGDGDPTTMGLDGGLILREQWGGVRPAEDAPVNGSVNSIAVADLDKAAAQVVAAGGMPIGERTELAGLGAIANFKDTEGNVFALFETQISDIPPTGRPIGFHYFYTDQARCTAFYEQVFGWRTEYDTDLACVIAATFDAHAPDSIPDLTSGINGLLSSRNAQGVPAIREVNAAVNVIQVDDIRAITTLACTHGAMQLDAIANVPHIGDYVYLADPENNVFSLLQLTVF